MKWKQEERTRSPSEISSKRVLRFQMHVFGRPFGTVKTVSHVIQIPLQLKSYFIKPKTRGGDFLSVSSFLFLQPNKIYARVSSSFREDQKAPRDKHTGKKVPWRERRERREERERREGREDSVISLLYSAIFSPGVSCL